MGDLDAPVLVCAGGILNTARRWDYLAATLSGRFRVVCLDWPGRGLSAWMPTQGDYSLETNVEVLLQLLDHLDADRASLIGSSLGGSVGMALAARHPDRVERLVLNDIGPYMPAENRLRRAQAVARHYVFGRPAGLFRRLGVSARNEGPVTEDELLHNTCFLIDLVGEDRKALRGLLDRFLRPSREVFEDLTAAVARSDSLETARRQSYKLKGAAGMVRAAKLARICLEIETVAGAGDREGTVRRIPALQAEWKRVATFIETFR